MKTLNFSLLLQFDWIDENKKGTIYFLDYTVCKKQTKKHYFFCFQDCPDGSDESQDVCEDSLVRRDKGDKARMVSGGLQIAREEVIETQSDEDQDDPDLMRLNPCSVWPPVCGQVCISVPHQVSGKQTRRSILGSVCPTKIVYLRET